MEMELKTQKLLISSMIYFLSHMAYAAETPAEIAARENDRIQQQLQQRQKYEQEQILQSTKPPTRIDVAPPEVSATDQGPCLSIHQIDVSGYHLLSSKKISQLVAPYINTCMGTRAIEVLMGKITAAYLNKGYVTSRVYLPEQDLKSGVLKLQVEEGKLTELKVTDRAQGTLSLDTALGDVKSKPLNLRDLEQAIDQINRLQSNNTKMEIIPGNQPGESIVVFDNDPSKRWNGYFTYDNKGQDSTGQNQAALGLSLDNPLGLNDLFSVTYNRSLPFKINHTDSYSGSAMYIIPLGYNTFNFSASRSEYDTTLETDFNQLLSHGETTTFSGKIDTLLHRGLNNQFRMNAGITAKDTEAFLEGVKLGVSSRKLSVFDLGFSYSDMILSGLVNVNVGYAKGLKIFNALEDQSDLSADAPKAQFDKMSYGISYFKGFNWLGQNFSISSSFSGQQAFDTLYGSEQFSIGSLYSVRGFNQNSLSGDHGYAFKNDFSLSKNYDFNGTPIFGRHTLGLDYGKVDNKENSNYVGELSSVSLSTTFNVSNVSLELIATQPIHQSNFMKKQSADVFFSSTFSF